MNQDKYSSIPIELQSVAKWLLSRNKVPFSKAGVPCNPFDSANWMTFADVLSAQGEMLARGLAVDIGHVVTPDSGLVCIDLDVKDETTHPGDPNQWTTQVEYSTFDRIYTAFDSYSELSTRGKGLHIWVKGYIPHNAKRNGVEIYNNHFIVVTGNVVGAGKLKSGSDLLNVLFKETARIKTDLLELKEIPASEDDWSVLTTCIYADNWEKFDRLWRGDWQQEWPSQSEADLALMSILAFYSQSNEQCRRIFRQSALGQREKATRDDRYLNYTLRLIRSRMATEDAHIDAEKAAAAAALAEAAIKARQGIEVPATPATPAAPATHGVAWPPGLVGDIARMFHRQSIRPVPEVAISAALGFAAGVAGVTWNFGNTGLNLYITLVARSAIGKEAMHSGVANLIRACLIKSPAITRFVDFNDYVSPQALIKGLSRQASFVNICGEFGRKLKMFNDESGPAAQLRTAITNFYQKSGKQSITGGLKYSNSDNNIDINHSVAYSLLGETTPSTYYDNLSSSMLEDGFLSRFVLIQYDGDRPPINDDVDYSVPDEIASRVGYICTYSQKAIDARQVFQVDIEILAKKEIDAYEELCDSKINSTDDEGMRQIYNRAALKVRRIAAILAVFDNYMNPVIIIEHVKYAISLIEDGNKKMAQAVESGRVGSDDTSRYKALKSYVNKFISALAKTDADFSNGAIISRRDLHMVASDMSCFRAYKYGLNKALRDTIDMLINDGTLTQVRAKDSLELGISGAAYRIMRID